MAAGAAPAEKDGLGGRGSARAPPRDRCRRAHASRAGLPPASGVLPSSLVSALAAAAADTAACCRCLTVCRRRHDTREFTLNFTLYSLCARFVRLRARFFSLQLYFTAIYFHPFSLIAARVYFTPSQHDDSLSTKRAHRRHFYFDKLAREPDAFIIKLLLNRRVLLRTPGVERNIGRGGEGAVVGEK